ncbi:DUF6648 family protein [Anaerotignum sp. MB30-C6]|uniref:DUF6648 family protein n=1 Tax=Anaerotignum sp. MB30-C6 TaxID=3070814 RepID=UPI0027DCC317|nr:DUF6648 family protein [Anaerotignum sp. MB30-C6]WMI81551.1 hypothetical protein RBQ60_02110 [Anaerotignum sp. MB30-C6]
MEARQNMNAIQKYFKYRQSLIDQYVKGDMTKREYLQKNYEAVVYGDIGPFTNMDSIEKALFNYQYYNALAKEQKSISTTKDMEYELKRDYLEQSNYYYNKKDRATLAVLKMLDFRGTEAYFVKVHSKYLKGKLFEIVIEDEDIILHSTSSLILKCLREEGVFCEESRKSLIDEYVNHRY